MKHPPDTCALKASPASWRFWKLWEVGHWGHVPGGHLVSKVPLCSFPFFLSALHRALHIISSLTKASQKQQTRTSEPMLQSSPSSLRELCREQMLHGCSTPLVVSERRIKTIMKDYSVEWPDISKKRKITLFWALSICDNSIYGLFTKMGQRTGNKPQETQVIKEHDLTCLLTTELQVREEPAILKALSVARQ